MSNLASPKTGCTSAELKQAWLCTRFAQPLLRCFGFTENRLHLGKAQARWATPKPLRFGHAQAREWLGMALDLLGALALLSVCTVFRVSNSVTNRSASRTQRARFYLHSAEVCARCEAATVRSFVLALSALHLTHSDTPPEIYFKSLF